MFYSLWKGLIIQSAVGWLLPLEHLWVQASSHQGVAHIIYISLKHTVRHHWFLSKPGVSMMQAHGWGKWWTCHPSGAVRGQDPDPWPGEARPASCHLSDTGWDHPSGRERPTMGGEEPVRTQTTCTRRKECTRSSRHISCAHRCMNKHLCT